MRESFSQDVLAIGQLQKDINQFLRRRVEGNYTFFASFYRENLLTTVALVDAVNTTPTDLPAQSIEGPPPADVVQEESGRQSYREKWKRGSDEGRVSIDGTVPLETASNVDVRPTIATPVPLWDVSEGSRTPTSRTTRTSFAFSPVTWGDRYRSMTPVDSPVFRPMMIPEGIPQECTQYQDPNATASMMDIDKPNDTQRADHISDEVSAAQTTEIVKEKRLSGGVLDVTGANGLESKKSEKECHEEAPAEESLPEVADTRSANPTEKEAPVLPSDADMDGIEASQKEQEKEETVLRRRKESMIPKPPGTALVSTVQKMKNLVTLVDHAPAHLIDLKTAHPATEKEVPPPAAATKKDKTEETHCAKQVNAEHPVRSFIDAVKRMEEVKIASGAHKAEIPALKKAALAREQEEKREAARKTRKDKRDQWKKLQKQQTQPAKIASKPEPPPGGKRTSAIEPSPNKKQRTEQIRPNKKNTQQAARQRITPSHTPIPGEGGMPAASPQYSLTPAGMMATDTRIKRKERRREKHVPSWAGEMALQNSVMAQKTVDPAKIFPPLATFDPTSVFGTPDSMVVRDAAARTYRYAHRAPSSCDWSDEDAED